MWVQDMTTSTILAELTKAHEAAKRERFLDSFSKRMPAECHDSFIDGIGYAIAVILTLEREEDQQSVPDNLGLK